MFHSTRATALPDSASLAAHILLDRHHTSGKDGPRQEGDTAVDTSAAPGTSIAVCGCLSQATVSQ
jgi:hypothetical protein